MSFGFCNRFCFAQKNSFEPQDLLFSPEVITSDKCCDVPVSVWDCEQGLCCKRISLSFIGKYLKSY